MKINNNNNNCKLCEIFDNQKLSGGLNGSDGGKQTNNITQQQQQQQQPHYCRHSLNSETAAAINMIPPHIRDMFFAAQILRGYYPGYQPAGPLISSHLLPQPIPPPLESDQTQSSQSSASTADNTDPDVIITGGDIAPRPQPYRYGPPAQDPNPYSRHPMHYPYQPNYYSPYGQPPPHQQPPPQEMCYQPYPYHQPKYYTSNAPPTYARRYMPTGYYQPPLDYRPPPQNVPQPPAGSQLVPAGPSGHMDPHYPSPQFYSPGYSPNGGAQCYNRNLQPPYLDTTQYHHHNTTSCPCPMQSCPKNGHGTGPINNAKGPVSSNNMLSTDNNAPMTTASANNSTSIISCKIENILASDIRIKPENDKTIDCKQQRESYDKVAIAPQPNYSLNVKVLEVPENSVSPSRGSIGLQLPPTQCEAVQPSELISDNISLSQRKARIGKTMERERQQQILLHGFQTAVSFISPATTPVLKQEYEVKQEMDVKKEKDYEENAVEDDYTQMSDDKMDIESDIKVEPDMVEDEIKDNIIDEKPQESKNSYVDRNTINLLNESSDECLDYSMDSTTKRKLQDHDDVIELSDNSTVAELPSSTVKRRKLFEKPALIAVKKSPPNSYKRLIKKSQPPPSYLTSSSKSRLITSNLNRIVNKSNLKRRCIFKSKAAIKKMKLAVKKRKLAQKKKEQEEAEAEEEESSSEKQSEVAENESVVQDAEEDTPSEAEKVNSNDDTSNEAPGESHEDKQLSDDNSEYSGKSNIDMTIDRVAKGYFSESEILSRLSKYRKPKSQKKLDAKRSKSEGNRSKSKKLDKDLKKVSDTTEEKTKEKCKKKQKKKDKLGASSSSSNNSNSLVNNNCNNCKDKNQNTKIKSTKSKDNKDKSIPISTSTTSTTTTTKKSKKTNNKVSTIAASKARSKTNNETLDFVTDIDTLTTNTIAIQSPPTTPTKRKQTTDKSEKKKKKAKTNKIIEEESSSNNREVETIEASTNQNDNGEGIEMLSDVTPVVPLIVETILSPSSPSPLPLPLLTTSTASPVKVKTLLLNETDVENNNDECFVDNNSKLKNKQQFQESLALYKTAAGWVTGNKVPGKRGRKGKFGNRKRHRLAPLEDIVIPRSSSIPRWSNGWQWEGEPYQAYVFLNSDDAPVVRTCYASMRHQEGDVIRPRDCVLMRAGNKKNELPYVAKVAQLWENPEDGEMMLSVFWYYRPEHTEIGRQENDAPDEVFASRHKDHNSVACIEDKCYVVTFREYCRYRRQLKATEENREEPPSVVPRLLKPERRTVPPATSPELIMFCRRVYDFRKRKL